jgi:hypothetical protein
VRSDECGVRNKTGRRCDALSQFHTPHSEFRIHWACKH